MTVIFDDLSDELCRVADLAEFIRLAHPDSTFALAAQDACIEVSALVEKLNTNVGIYTALKASVEQGDRFPETEVDRHVGKLFLQDFHQCGIHLGEDDRQKVVELTEKILRTGQIFAANCQVGPILCIMFVRPGVYRPKTIKLECLKCLAANLYVKHT